MQSADYRKRFKSFFHSEFRNRQSAIEKMDTQSRYLRLRRKDIAYFKFIIESYEGMALVRTKDPHEAVVELMVAPGWEKEVSEVLKSLGGEIPIEDLSGY